eukprot:7379145-Prymnesium_polylepis.1
MPPSRRLAALPHFAGEASLPVASVVGTINSQRIELDDQVGEVLTDVAHRCRPGRPRGRLPANLNRPRMSVQ